MTAPENVPVVPVIAPPVMLPVPALMFELFVVIPALAVRSALNVPVVPLIEPPVNDGAVTPPLKVPVEPVIVPPLNAGEVTDVVKLPVVPLKVPPLNDVPPTAPAAFTVNVPPVFWNVPLLVKPLIVALGAVIAPRLAAPDVWLIFPFCVRRPLSVKPLLAVTRPENVPVVELRAPVVVASNVVVPLVWTRLPFNV